MGGGGEGGSNGAREELIETVLTCEGNIKDPKLPLKISRLIHHLQIITDCKSSDWLVNKVEPWNSVRVTFSIPKEAARRLHQLAQSDATALRQLGILSVQVDGDQIVSLKVAGPNNETAEVIIRTDSLAGSSGDGCSSSSRSNHAPSLPSLPPVFSHHNHHPHPVPQFRSPTVQHVSEGFSHGRLVSQSRPHNQHEYPYGEASTVSTVPARQAQTSSVNAVSGNLHAIEGLHRPSVPVNPPPPYPSHEVRQVNKNSSNNTHQVVGPSSFSRQFTSQSIVSSLPGSIQNSHTINHSQSVTSGYRVQGTITNVNTKTNLPNRGNQVKGQVNMVKNSPLLVGLLQQPEQNSSGTSGLKNKAFLAVTLSQSNVSYSNSVIENGSSNTSDVNNIPLVNTVSSMHPRDTPQSSVTESSMTHTTSSWSSESFSSKLTDSSLQYQSIGQSSLDSRMTSVASLSSSVQCNPVVLPSNVTVSKENKNIENTKEENSSSTTSKMESQYLINPNTGLLEPRPNTDSSDSEPEFGNDSPDNFPSSGSLDENFAFSERNDRTDSILNRVSDIKEESASDFKNNQDKSKNSTSWEDTSHSTNTGEKIKLRLKLGKEQVAQTTFVESPNRKLDNRKEISGSLDLQTHQSPEPKVPKLHIKLHFSQPVIIKPVEENENVSQQNYDTLNKDDKLINRKKTSKLRSKNCEVSLESFKCKPLKDKVVLDNSTEEDISLNDSKGLIDLKPPNSELEADDRSAKYKEAIGTKSTKLSRISDFTKPKLENKLRNRVKKPCFRKVGDLNSVGEIASHKIMETLPPSITKVAALHTHQPHRNPNSFSPIPFPSSVPSSVVGEDSLSSLATTLPATTTSHFTSSSSSSSSSSSFSDLPTSEVEDHHSETPKISSKIDSESGGADSDILMTTFRMNSSPIKNLVNGDLTHSEKLKVNQMRYKKTGSLSSNAEYQYPSTTKLTIKRKNIEETQNLKSLKKDGLTAVPTFLNSSVLINKVTSDHSPIVSGVTVSSTNRGSEVSSKLCRRLENTKGPMRNELSGLKSNSDITIHSVSKSDIFSLSKMSEHDKKSDFIVKSKPETSTKVGKVTCVDVMDRKALEEALKSSRNSSKKNESAYPRSASSMVDRLRRWNSIDSSGSVPSLSSPSHTQIIPDSTNSKMSALIKDELKDRGEKICINESNLFATTALSSGENIKKEYSVSHHTLTENVNINSCDTNGKEAVENKLNSPLGSSCHSESNNSEIIVSSKPHLNDIGSSAIVTSESTKSLVSLLEKRSSISESDVKDLGCKNKCEQGKLTDLSSSVSTMKAEIESPEGTPKGEHGNGQGGEDSGIESMDTLSEKSPNHSDQSPSRKEEKECDLFSDKIKSSKILAPSPKVKIEKKDTFESKIGQMKNDATLGKGESVTSERILNFSLKAEPCLTKGYLEIDREGAATSEDTKTSKSFESSFSTNFQDHQYAKEVRKIKSEDHSSSVKEKVDLCLPASDCGISLGNNSHDKNSFSYESNNVSSCHSMSPVCFSDEFTESTSQVLPTVLSSSVVTTNMNNTCVVKTFSLAAPSITTSSLTVSSPKSSIVTSSSRSTSSSFSENSNPLHSLLPLKSENLNIILPIDNALAVKSASSISLAENANIITNSKVSERAVSHSSTDISVSEVEIGFSSNCELHAPSNISNSSNMSSASNVAHSTSVVILTAATSLSTIISSSSNTKVVSLKPGLSQSHNPPLGKAFRLVAVHGINSMAPSSSPVKGQIVTVKPAVACTSPSFSKNSSLLQPVSSIKLEESTHSILKARLTSEFSSTEQLTSPSKTIESISSSSESHIDDLDFVGFSSPEKVAFEVKDLGQPVGIVPEEGSPHFSTAKEEPAPLRLNPPLYTYGNKEKKKEIESDYEDREKEESEEHKIIEGSKTSLLSTTEEGVLKISEFEAEEVIDKDFPTELCSSNAVSLKDRKLNELTIEIPNVDILPDEKRLTRSTRHSARLASPKVSSPAGGEVSPRNEKRNLNNLQAHGRPSPVGLLRSSVSPALKGIKRRRHESESSSASNLSEELTEPSVKVISRRKVVEKVLKDGDKQKVLKKEQELTDKEKDFESSDEEISLDGDLNQCLKRKGTSELSGENEETSSSSRPSSRSGRSSKTVTRSRDRNLPCPDSLTSTRAATPTRRTPRQNKAMKTTSPPSPSSVDQALTSSLSPSSTNLLINSDKTDTHSVISSIELVTEKKTFTSLDNKVSPVKSLPRLRKESEADSAELTSGRRKTRSATQTVVNIEDSKRRRQSKEK